MNNRGFISLTFVFIILMVIVALAFIQNGGQVEVFRDQVINGNATNWSYIATQSNMQKSINIAFTGQDKPLWLNSMGEIIWKAIDFFGTAIMAITKMAMSIVIENPNIINYKVLMIIVVFSLLAPLIYPIFIITISLILIIKEWFAIRKERKQLNILKGGKVNG